MGEEKNQLEFILEAHKSVCSRVSSETALDVKPITTTEPRVLVKAEPELQQSTVRHLTPTNILTPIMVNMTTSSSSSSSSGLLQTPTVSTPSCGSQQRTNR